MAEGTLRIVIAPPRITSNLSLTVEIGDSFSYQITATHNPFKLRRDNLPSGLQLDPATGLITGTLNSAGSFFAAIVAHTPFGDAIGQLRSMFRRRISPARLLCRTSISGARWPIK